ncbi:MAG: RNA-guided endonuclease TnpB family protein [Clostridia bacterium]
MNKILTYTYRIYPNKSQIDKIEHNFKCAREVYNHLLSARIVEYERYKKNAIKFEKVGKKLDLTKFNKSANLPSIPSIKNKYPYLKEADSLALCAEWGNLNRAFSNFYSKRCKFPRYKKRNDKNTYITSCVNNNIRIQNNKLKLPKIGYIKIKLHRPLPKDYRIKRVIVRGDKCGRYYVAIVIKFPLNEVKKKAFGKIVGLDFKIGEVFVSSEAQTPEYNKPYRNNLEELRGLEKKLSEKRKFSKNWWKHIGKIRESHKKVVFKRKDFLHKLSFQIKNEYDTVVIESLSLEDISQKLSTGMNVYDTSYRSFVNMLKYKMEGENIVEIDKWFPSSKMCSCCKSIKKELDLSERIYSCNYCGNIIDRDLNAAINIRNEGERLIKNIKK